MHFGTDFDDFTAILLLLQSSFYIGNCYNQCNILILTENTFRPKEKIKFHVAQKKISSETFDAGEKFQRSYLHTK